MNCARYYLRNCLAVVELIFVAFNSEKQAGNVSSVSCNLTKKNKKPQLRVMVEGKGRTKNKR